MKKLLKLTALIISLILALYCVSCKHSNDDDDPVQEEENFPAMGALKSLKAVEGVPKVYTAEFEGDYFLDDVIGSNIATSRQLLSYLYSSAKTWVAKENTKNLTINVQGAACSSIVAKNADESVGGLIYGRNFDWDPGASLILHTKPTKGYESVSTCFLQFVSLDPDWEPNTNTDNNMLALACIYVPMDGMNEKGLYIANLNNQFNAIIPDTSDTSKKYVQTTVAIRYILDRAKNVDEAVNWLQTFVMCPVYGDLRYSDGSYYDDYHFAIADNEGEGHSVVVEWIDGEMKVVKTKIVTNHSLAKIDKDNNENLDIEDDIEVENEADYSGYHSYERFMRLWKAQKEEMSVQEIKEALRDVQKDNSVWSAVFEPSAKRVTYYFRKANIFEGVSKIPADPDNYNHSEYKEYDDAMLVPIDYNKPVVVQF